MLATDEIVHKTKIRAGKVVYLFYFTRTSFVLSSLRIYHLIPPLLTIHFLKQVFNNFSRMSFDNMRSGRSLRMQLWRIVRNQTLAVSLLLTEPVMLEFYVSCVHPTHVE